MNLKLKCGCGAGFLAPGELRGKLVRCPKCQKTLRVPDTVTSGADESASGSPSTIFVTADPSEETGFDRGATRPQPAKAVAWPATGTGPATLPETSESRDSWHPPPLAPAGRGVGGEGLPASSASGTGEKRRGGWGKLVLLVLVLITPVGVVGTLFVLPLLMPKDPRELVAQRYLDAIRREDWPEANRLSVLTAHPRLVRVEGVSLTDRESPPIRGKFLGLAEFHARIDQKYRFNQDRGRFDLKDTTGTGLEVLSKIEQVKQKVEEKVAASSAEPKQRRRNPEDQLLDETIARYGAIAELAQNPGGLLSSQNLGPTYEDLLNATDVPLSDVERSLGAHYAKSWAKWERLLGRSFLTLPGGGEFELQQVEIKAVIRTEGQSYSEPGRTLTIRLVRFSMATIDTGWRVWSAE